MNTVLVVMFLAAATLALGATISEPNSGSTGPVPETIRTGKQVLGQQPGGTPGGPGAPPNANGASPDDLNAANTFGLGFYGGWGGWGGWGGYGGWGYPYRYGGYYGGWGSYNRYPYYWY